MLSRTTSSPVGPLRQGALPANGGERRSGTDGAASLRRSVSFHRSVSIREFNKETDFWQRDYEDVEHRVETSLVEGGVDGVSIAGGGEGEEDGEDGSRGYADSAAAGDARRPGGGGGPEGGAGSAAAAAAPGAGARARGDADADDVYNFRIRARWDVVLEEVCVPCGGDGDGGETPAETMPTNNELRRLCDALIYSWHQQELQSANRNVFMLVDQGRVRRRFGHDWAGYFRFRLERFPAVALMMLASLSSRPKSFYLDSYERRSVVLAVLQVSLNAHESSFLRGGTYFSTSRCAACDAMKGAAQRRRAAAAAVRASLPSSPSEGAPGGDDDAFASHSIMPPRNGMLKRVTSLPVMSAALDRSARAVDAGGGGGDPLKALVDGAAAAAAKSAKPEHGPAPVAPAGAQAKAPGAARAGDAADGAAAAAAAAASPAGEPAGPTTKASRARLFFRNSMQSIRNLVGQSARR